MSDLKKNCSNEHLSNALFSFYPLILSFHLQIAYGKVRSLLIGVEKLVGKVSA